MNAEPTTEYVAVLSCHLDMENEYKILYKTLLKYSRPVLFLNFSLNFLPFRRTSGKFYFRVTTVCSWHETNT